MITSKRVLVAVFSLFLVTLVKDAYKLNFSDIEMDGPYHKDSIDLFEYVKTNVSDDQSIAFFKPRVLTLFTHKKAIYIRSPEKVDVSPVIYLIARKEDVIDQAAKKRSDYKPLYENSSFVVYQVKSL